jgi:hypothetical protein
MIKYNDDFAYKYLKYKQKYLRKGGSAGRLFRYRDTSTDLGLSIDSRPSIDLGPILDLGPSIDLGSSIDLSSTKHKIEKDKLYSAKINNQQYKFELSVDKAAGSLEEKFKKKKISIYDELGNVLIIYDFIDGLKKTSNLSVDTYLYSFDELNKDTMAEESLEPIDDKNISKSLLSDIFIVLCFVLCNVYSEVPIEIFDVASLQYKLYNQEITFAGIDLLKYNVLTNKYKDLEMSIYKQKVPRALYKFELDECKKEYISNLYKKNIKFLCETSICAWIQNARNILAHINEKSLEELQQIFVDEPFFMLSAITPLFRHLIVQNPCDVLPTHYGVQVSGASSACEYYIKFEETNILKFKEQIVKFYNNIIDALVNDMKISDQETTDFISLFKQRFLPITKENIIILAKVLSVFIPFNKLTSITSNHEKI